MKKKGKIILWSSLTGVAGVLAIGLLCGTLVAQSFRNNVNRYFGTSDYELKKGHDTNENTTYFEKMDLGEDKDHKKLIEYDKGVAEEISQEGITLLKNDNNTLPLAKNSAVTLMGIRSAHLISCGGGSADISAVEDQVTLEQALKDNSVSVEPNLYSKLSTATANDTDISELSVDVYKSYENDYKQYGDAAIITLGRRGAEMSDMYVSGTNYSQALNNDPLSLSLNELNLLNYAKTLKENGTIKKIVVLLNTTNQLNFNYYSPNGDGSFTTKKDYTEDFDIDSVLWVGYTGTYGANAIADILTGKVNPSGHLVDTYAYDSKRAPAYVDFFTNKFKDAENGVAFDNGVSGAKWHDQTLDSNMYYSIYSEGIYIGYRYYETRYEDAVLNQGNVGNFDYENEVKYPFGYGLSYTNFEKTISNFQYDESTDKYEVTVEVKNTGTTAGKDAVQVYIQKPYDSNSTVEKAAIELAGFAKTPTIEPNQTRTVEVTIDGSQLASYDMTTAKTYVADEGTYYFSVGENAHTALNNILLKKGVSSSKLSGNGNENLVKDVTISRTIYDQSKGGLKVTNQLEDADLNYYLDENDEKYTYLSRSNWTNTFPVPTTAGNELVSNEKMRKNLYLYESYESDPNTDVKMPVTGADTDYKLISLRGVDYDDSKWNVLLDQLTVEEMATTSGEAFHQTIAMESVAKPGTVDDNGPQGFTTSLISSGTSAYCAYTDENIMAATFNVELMEKVGKAMGNDMLNKGDNVVGLYGPAMNTHRSAYGGRNFEYYSEDGLLSGKIAAAEIKGIQSYGNYVYIKHFALNDQETHCRCVSTFAQEQAIREIYLRPFQIAIEEGGAYNVMNAFARFGTTWSGAHKGLMTNILRGEFGLKGFAISDYNQKSLSFGSMSINGYSFDAVTGLLAGTDAWDASGSRGSTWTEDFTKLKNDPVVVSALRESAHRILYTVVNSHAMNGISSSDEIVRVTPWWEALLISFTSIFFVLFAGSAVYLTYIVVKKKKGE